MGDARTGIVCMTAVAHYSQIGGTPATKWDTRLYVVAIGIMHLKS